MSVTRAALLAFMRSHRYAVQSSVHAGGSPQSAVVGIAVSDDFEIVFDTVDTSRKAGNLRKKPDIAFVIGGLDNGDERTVQYEGIADEPRGRDRARLSELYLSVFPDGRTRQSWPGFMYVRATPQWLRYSDYSQNPPMIVEFSRDDLARMK